MIAIKKTLVWLREAFRWFFWKEVECIDVFIEGVPHFECRFIGDREEGYEVSSSDPLSETGRPDRYIVSKGDVIRGPYTKEILTLLP